MNQHASPLLSSGRRLGLAFILDMDMPSYVTFIASVTTTGRSQ